MKDRDVLRSTLILPSLLKVMPESPEFSSPSMIYKYATTTEEPEWKFTYGPLYSSLDSNDPDAHNEFTDGDILRKAVHEWAARGDRGIYFEHGKELIGEAAEWTSFPYAVTAQLEVPGREPIEKTFPAHTVYFGIYWQQSGWNLIKSAKLRGLSMGGSAQRMEGYFE